ncbi:serine/threonine receptor-like kinase NFP [Rhodamnia argentea]|uniref:Serine/threonine receptor-like kinase NFP n=1 Tax=Rhodamnia argentea TaxID=178133 RepID=A0A8B8Q8N3_9MYRT|nr:serine/threonine receptor-like kinase NFP [Rhodamnia argentea]
MMGSQLHRSPLLLLFFVVVLFLHRSHAQPNITGYTCTANQTHSPCQTYAFYRASLSQNYTDLASIGDLFGVSRLMIADPSNISSSALSATLAADQPLFVPLTCSCNPHNGTNISYANITYTIRAGDTFLRLSTGPFENLTSYQSVELVNPDLVATNLTIGVDAVFPIFCKCPNETQSTGGVNFLVSYVLQPSDNLSSVASRFGIQEQSIVSNNTKSTETLFLPFSKLPSLTQPIVSANTSAPSAREERTGLIVGLAIGVGVLGVFLILGIALWLHRERSNKKRVPGPGPANLEGDGEKRMARGEKGPREMEVNLMADVSGCLDKYRVFGIDELKEATDGFSSRCLIQGSVYKGFLDGEVFAIKKMKWNAYEELKILQKVNHGNLVRLEGFCIDPEDANCYLIYEFLPNGSLHSWLHDAGGHQGRLSWKTRLRIAFDVANGLQYIHEHTRPRVVHKDIKSSNILLDSNMRAKIANFGLAKSGCNAITMHIVGTQGYIAPEYLSDGVVSTRMDVFSFGVVLLELVSGREAMDEEGRVMWAAAVEAFGGRSSEEIGKAERLRGWMDEALVADSSCSVESVASVVSVAISCLNRDPAKRPSMVDIVYALCKSDDVFDFSEDGFSAEAQVSAR